MKFLDDLGLQHLIAWIKQMLRLKADKTYVDKEISNVELTPGPQGIQGEQGEQGVPGTDANVTKENVESALGHKVDSTVPPNAKFTDTIYTHPSTHPASMITESATKRFVTDTEKGKWNAKAEKSDIPTKVSELTNDGIYVTSVELGDAGFGDMSRSVYDKDNSGVVDNAEKVSGHSVASDVPANAKFTDTVYTHPSTHPADMIVENSSKRFVTDAEKNKWNSQETPAGAQAKATKALTDSKTYVDNKVKTDVPAEAKFTDTVYTHPSTHPASMITETSARRFMTDTDKNRWDAKETPDGAQAKATKALNDARSYTDGKVKTDVPENAKFTDTIYTHPSTHPYSMITGTPTSLPASGGDATSAKHLIGDDTRSQDYPPSTYMSGGARFQGRAGWQTEFKRITTLGVSGFTGTYVYLQTHTPWSDSSGGYPIQVVYGNGTPVWRVGTSTSAWSAWKEMNDGGNAATVNGRTVGTNVPANAKFTDTVYTHPSTHPASMITESATKRFVTDTEKSSWNAKETPAGAQAKVTAAINNINKVASGRTEPTLSAGDIWMRET